MRFKENLSKKGYGQHSLTADFKLAAKGNENISVDDVFGVISRIGEKNPQLSKDLFEFAQWAGNYYKPILRNFHYLCIALERGPGGVVDESTLELIDVVESSVRYYIESVAIPSAEKASSPSRRREFIEGGVAAYKLFSSILLELDEVEPSDSFQSVGAEILQKRDEDGRELAKSRGRRYEWRSPQNADALEKELNSIFKDGINDAIKKASSFAQNTPGCPDLDADSVRETLTGMNIELDIDHIQRSFRSKNTVVSRVSEAALSIGKVVSSYYLEHTLKDMGLGDGNEKVARLIESYSQSSVEYGKIDSLWSRSGFSDRIIEYARSRFPKATLVSAASSKKKRQSSLSSSEWAKITNQFFEDVKKTMLTNLNPGNGVIEEMFAQFPNYQSPFYNALRWFDSRYESIREKTDKSEADLKFLTMYANKGEAWGKSISGHSRGLADLVASEWTSAKHIKNEDGEGYVRADKSNILPRISKALFHSVASDAQGINADMDTLYGNKKDVGVDDVVQKDVDLPPIPLPPIPSLPPFLESLVSNFRKSSFDFDMGLFAFAKFQPGPGYVFLANAVTIFEDLIDNSKGGTAALDEKDEEEETIEVKRDPDQDDSIELRKQPRSEG